MELKAFLRLKFVNCKTTKLQGALVQHIRLIKEIVIGLPLSPEVCEIRNHTLKAFSPGNERDCNWNKL